MQKYSLQPLIPVHRQQMGGEVLGLQLCRRACETHLPSEQLLASSILVIAWDDCVSVRQPGAAA